MTAYRGSVTFKIEETPGVEKGTVDTGFEYLAPGMDFTYTPNNNVKYTYTVGSKIYDVANAGRFSGTWNCNVLLDYNHFKWLLLAFSDYEYSGGKHTFTMSNVGTRKSATFRVKKMNRAVGGSFDQTIKLLGCVCTSVSFSYESTSTSTIRCTMSGFYLKEKVKFADLTATDHDDVEPSTVSKIPVEWGCLQLYEGDTFVPVANNEKTGFTLSSTVSPLPSCGSRFDSGFYEGQLSKTTVKMQTYSRNGRNYLRVYNGGKAPEDTDISKSQWYEPKAKMLQPLEQIRIASTYTNDEATPTKNYSCNVTFTNAIFESMSQTYNSSSEIVDAPSISVRDVTLEITSADVTSDLTQ